MKPEEIVVYKKTKSGGYRIDWKLTRSNLEEYYTTTPGWQPSERAMALANIDERIAALKKMRYAKIQIKE